MIKNADIKIPTLEECRKNPAPPGRITGGLYVSRGIKKESLPGKPLVSIITVVYNGEDCLEPTIKSVIEQSYDNIEYIVVNSGSTDNTLEIIKKYEDYIYNWVSVPNERLYRALNNAISFCTGELIGIIHADDIYEKDAVSSIVRAYQKSDGKSIITGHCKMLFSDRSKWRIWITDVNDLLPYQTIPHPSTFVPLSVYETYGLFDTSFKIAADQEFFCRCYQQSVHFIVVDRVISIFGPPGISSKYYLGETEKFRIRLRYKLNIFKSITMSSYSFLTITIHKVLEYLNLWHLVEARRHAKLWKL